MDDDTFDDINEHSFVDDHNSNSEHDDNLNNVLAGWDDLPQGPSHGFGQPLNPHQHGSSSGQGQNNQDQPVIPSQDHDFQSQVHVVVRPRVGPERSHIPEPRPQNVETEVFYLFIFFFGLFFKIVNQQECYFFLDLDYGTEMGGASVSIVFGILGIDLFDLL
jgi:hypothetical protein